VLGRVSWQKKAAIPVSIQRSRSLGASPAESLGAPSPNGSIDADSQNKPKGGGSFKAWRKGKTSAENLGVQNAKGKTSAESLGTQNGGKGVSSASRLKVNASPVSRGTLGTQKKEKQERLTHNAAAPIDSSLSKIQNDVAVDKCLPIGGGSIVDDTPGKGGGSSVEDNIGKSIAGDGKILQDQKTTGDYQEGD
jgi:hypothetical protein